MMKNEFEEMTIRSNESISDTLYETIERFYMSENEYHRCHGGINETKQEFVNRVFGGKVNTVKSIAKKVLLERISENTYCLNGCQSATKKRLDEMNLLLAEQTAWEVYGNCGVEYQVMKDYLKKVA
jgi:hypothetical protein